MLVKRYKFIATFLMIITYFIWFCIYTGLGNNSISNGVIIFVSWIGVIETFIYLFVWRRLTGKILSLFSVFLIFFLVFDFGQCILWMFSTNFSGSLIQNHTLYSSIIIDNMIILKAQLLYVICLSTLNFGAILIYRPKEKNETSISETENDDMEWRYKILFNASLFMSIFAIPATIYSVIVSYSYRLLYGYHDLYYGVSVGRVSTFVNILSVLFLPCLLGLLIGSHYKKRVRIIVYIIFGIYAIISLLCGDRGEWMLKLVILFYADMRFYKKRSVKNVAILVIVGYFLLYFIDAIVGLRNSTLSIESVRDSLAFNNSPLISLLSEFGSTMGVVMVLLKSAVVFPFGNSFLMSILTAPATSIAGIFGLDYVQLSTWFSQDYLGISYGADFSLIGECVLNFGEFLGPIFMILIGILIMVVSQFAEDQNKSPLWMCISLSIMCVILKWPRTTFWYVLNQSFYIIIICLAVYALFLLLSGRVVQLKRR